MQYLREILHNEILWTTIIAWFLAQIIKVIYVSAKTKKLDFSRMVGSGGMPSSHSSFCVSLAVAVGFNNGFSSASFAICVCFALVVMYDAAGVRRSAGEQAKILNKIVEEWGRGDFTHTETKLKELLGHTPIEVIAGAILGLAVAIIRHIF